MIVFRSETRFATSSDGMINDVMRGAADITKPLHGSHLWEVEPNAFRSRETDQSEMYHQVATFSGTVIDDTNCPLSDTFAMCSVNV